MELTTAEEIHLICLFDELQTAMHFGEEIDGYLKSHSVLDKAGAYAVQDGVVVKGYKGSYTNIVGLPIEKLSALTGLPSELPEAPPDIEKY